MSMAKQKAITFGQFEKNLKYINAVDSGFVYRITFRVGAMVLTYIGQKHYKKWDAKKHVWKDTDWRTYNSSSKAVKALLAYASDVQYSIIDECLTSNGLCRLEYGCIQKEWATNLKNNINLQVGANNRRKDYFEMQKAINIILESCIRKANYTTIIVGEK